VCGRYTLGTDEEALIEAFDAPSLTFDFVSRFNIAPGQSAPVVAEDGRGRRIAPLTWGLVWVRPGCEARHTFAIMTTSASQDIASVHDRMPLVVEAPDAT
jgi:putative SOS response-associated peptidase YedK